ncbi:MAG: BlaI/MecI/CopY family transcriptional regulator [Saprospiraceae bacterium]|nr:BlaI/MecI/CopY family transcriptional regulator [Saprospiraceae bacterium]
MKEQKSYSPTSSELEILQILWKRGPCYVKEIHELLSESKEVVYTTTLKTMQVMHERGLLSREAQGRRHLYQAAIAEDDAQNVLLDKFVQKTFEGSALKLVMKALGNYKTSQGDLDELKKYIESIEKDKS